MCISTFVNVQEFEVTVTCVFQNSFLKVNYMKLITRFRKMAYTGVEFVDDGSVALVCTEWFTPRKRQVFWPPFRTQDQYDKVLKKLQTPDDTWTLYAVKRSFFASGKLNCKP